MIQVKLSDLVNSSETLQKLGQKDFKAKLAWSIARLLKAAETEIQGFTEARMNLIRKYGVKTETGDLFVDEKGNYRVEPEHVNDFNKEVNELAATEVEINANKIPFELLENEDFTPVDMALLEPFIEE